MKKCNTCNQEKPLTEFCKAKKSKDGYNWKCKECFKMYYKSYYKKNNSSLKEYAKDYRIKNESYLKQYYLDNYEYYSNYRKNYQPRLDELQKEYHIKNPHIRRWRDLLRDTIKRLDGNKINTTHNLLKYSPNQLKEHLESQGMDWNLHQIEHKIPVSWFKKDTPPHIVNDLRNLQPLTPQENQSKGNRYSLPVDTEYAKEVLQFIKREYVECVVPQR